MLNYSIRHYLELSHILIFKNVDITDFTQKFSLSYYEYNADLKTLKSMSQLFGIEFVLTDSRISYSIVNNVLFENKFEMLNGFYFRNILSKPKNTIIIDSIITMKLIETKGYINVTELADEISYSKSNIRNRIKWGRSILENYSINTVSKPHYGLSVVGSEFYKRLLIFSINNSFDLRLLDDEDKNIIFNDVPISVSTKIENVIRDTIFINQDYYASINLFMLRNYLSIQYNRHYKGLIADELFKFDPEPVYSTYEFSISTKICEYLDITDNLKLEALYLAIFLIIINEYSFIENDEFTNINNLYDKSSCTLQTKIEDFLFETYQIKFTDSLYREALRNAINKFHSKSYFNLLKIRSFDISGKRYHSTNDPLIMIIENEIKNLMSDYFGKKIPSSQLSELMELTQRHLQNLPISTSPKKIGIITRFNKYDCLLLKQQIERSINDSLYTSIKLFNFNNYDLINLKDFILITERPFQFSNKSNVYYLDDNDNSLYNLNYFLKKQRIINLTNVDIKIKETKNLNHSEFISFVKKITNSNNLVDSNNKYFSIKIDTTINETKLVILKNTMKTTNNYAIQLIFNTNNNELNLMHLLLKIFSNHQQYIDELINQPTMITINKIYNEFIS